MKLATLEIELLANLAKFQDTMEKAAKTSDATLRNIEKSAGFAQKALGSLFSAVAVQALARIVDNYKKFDAQLKLSTKSLNEYHQAYANVIRIGRTAQSDIGAIGVLYARLNNNLREFNVTQKDIAGVTETITLALRVNNATVQETNSVMLQLSQSFGSGRLNGQEFLAVTEGAPLLMQQLAKSLKVPYGALKDLSAQGKITRADLLKAWNDPEYLAALRENVKQVGTISSAITVALNNIKQFVGEQDKATGSSKALALGIIFLSDNINWLVKGALAALAVSVKNYIASVYAKIAALRIEAMQTKQNAILAEQSALRERVNAETAIAMDKLKLISKVNLQQARVNEAKASLQAVVNTNKEAGATAILEKETYRLVMAKGALAKANNLVGVGYANNAAAVTKAHADTVRLAQASSAARVSILSLSGAITGLRTLFTMMGGWVTVAITAIILFGDKILNLINKVRGLTPEIKELNDEIERTHRLQKLGIDPTSTTADTEEKLSKQVTLYNQINAELVRKKSLIESRKGMGLPVTKEEAELAKLNERLKVQSNLMKNQLPQAINSTSSAIAGVSQEFTKLNEHLKTAKERSDEYARNMQMIIVEGHKQGLTQAEITAKLKLLKEEYDKATGAAKANKEENKYALEALQEQVTEELMLADEAGKAYAEFRKAQAEAINDVLLAGAEENDALKKQIKLVEDNIELLNLGEDAQNRMAEARLRDAIATSEQIIAQGKLNGLSGDALAYAEAYLFTLNERLDLQQKLSRVEKEEERIKAVKKAEKDRVKANKEANDEIEAANDRMYRNLARSITDSVVRGFEQGLSFVDNFKQAIKNAFKSFVVNVGVNFFQNGLESVFGGMTKNIFGSIAGIFGASGSAFAGGNNGVLTSGLLDQAKGVFDVITKGFDGANAALQGSIESFGAMLANGNGGILDTIGGAIGQYSGVISNALPFAGSLLKLISGDTKGALGSALGAALTFTPLGAVGGIIGSLIGGSLFGGKKQPPRTTTALPEVSKSFNDSLSALLGGFGLSDSVSSYAHYRGRAGGSGYGHFDASVNGRSLNERVRYKDAYGQETMEQFIKTALTEYLVKAINLTGLPQGIKLLFAGLTDSAQINNMIVASVKLNSAQKQLSDRFGLTVDMAGRVSKATGLAGDALATFVTQLASVADAFKTPSQRLIELREGLTSTFKSTLGTVITKTITESVAKQVLVSGANTLSAFNAGISPLRGGIGTAYSPLPIGMRASNTGIASLLQIFKLKPVYKTVFETVTRSIDTVILSLRDLPQSIDEFDSLLKAIDKSTQAGQKMFADLFAIRDQFLQYINTLNEIKKGVSDTIFSLLTPQEQLAINQARLAEEFAKFNLAVPDSVQQLIAIGDGIDYTTEAGLNLAMAFPNLVQAFQATQGAVDSLANSLNPDMFKTFADYVVALSYANVGVPYSQIPAANLPSYDVGTSYVPSDGAAMLHRGEGVLTSGENSSISFNSDRMVQILQAMLHKISELEYDIKRTADGAQRTARELEDITGGDVAITTQAA